MNRILLRLACVCAAGAAAATGFTACVQQPDVTPPIPDDVARRSSGFPDSVFVRAAANAPGVDTLFVRLVPLLECLAGRAARADTATVTRTSPRTVLTVSGDSLIVEPTDVRGPTFFTLQSQPGKQLAVTVESDSALANPVQLSLRFTGCAPPGGSLDATKLRIVNVVEGAPAEELASTVVGQNISAQLSHLSSYAVAQN